MIELPHSVPQSRAFIPCHCGRAQSQALGAKGRCPLSQFSVCKVTPHSSVGLGSARCYLTLFVVSPFFSWKIINSGLAVIFKIQRKHSFGCIFCRAFWLFEEGFSSSHFCLKCVCEWIVAGIYSDMWILLRQRAEMPPRPCHSRIWLWARGHGWVPQEPPQLCPFPTVCPWHRTFRRVPFVIKADHVKCILIYTHAHQVNSILIYTHARTHTDVYLLSCTFIHWDGVSQTNTFIWQDYFLISFKFFCKPFFLVFCSSRKWVKII